MPLPIRLSRRALSAISFAVVAILGTAPLHADVDSQSSTGADGTDGANGTVTEIDNNGMIQFVVTPGGNGVDGGVASCSAQSTDQGNTSGSTGGNGGNGGNGAAASPDNVSLGGNGGEGGDATADAEDSDSITLDYETIWDYANAYGGNGGNGGAGGSLHLGPTAKGGNGGDGGSASAIADGDLSWPSNGMNVYAAAYGGNGGNGAGYDGSGGRGGVASLGEINAYNDSQPNGTGDVIAEAFGGSGGHGSGTAFGGDGASETINNAADIAGYASYDFTVDQVAAGGDSGGSNSGFAGVAGSATSNLDLTNIWTTFLTVTVSAYGGGGGTSENTTGGTGGNATATVNLSEGANLTAEADVNDNASGPDSSNGKGSDIDSGTGNAGAGGSGTASATTSSDATGQNVSHAISTAIAFGGNGGNVIDGASGDGGAGGAANATANATSPGADGGLATATATGGAGGSGAGSGNVSGNGGSATAVATVSVNYAYLNDYTQTVQAQATATGGNSDAPTSSAGSGTGGAASASAAINGVTILQVVNGSGATGGLASVASTWSTTDEITVSVGASNVNNGSVTVTGPGAVMAGITGSGNLTIGDGSAATALQLTTNGGASSQSGLIINSGSFLDIANNHLLINYGSSADPISTIRGYLKSGYNGGNWNGPGISSYLAAANHQYGIGYADSADSGNPAGLSSHQIEIKYTLYGDANLDGVVNSVDFGILAANFGRSGKTWDEGNFNYNASGVVNSVDFGLLAANFGKSASGAAVEISTADWAALDAFAQANGLMSEVPEPSSVGALAIGSIALFARRRLRRRSG